MKRKWISAILTLGLTMTFAGCASTPKTFEMVEEEESNPDFEKALKALEQERYREAAPMFDKLLVANPATERDLVVVFNSGAAYEGMGNCAKASERYREVVRSSARKFSQIEALALFRSSLMYECLGQDAKAVSSLLDARKRGKDLTFEVHQAEIPARLAAAYARLGNRAKALEYFNMASEGLKKIVSRTNNHRQKEILGRTLFLMGQLNPAQRTASVSASSFMQSLSMQQPYLLQAVEIDHPVWSKKAAADLELGYENIWKYNIAAPEELRAFYTRGLQAIQELRKIRLPNASPRINTVFTQLEKTETRINAELAKIAEHNKLTPAAEAREGLKRQGRVVDPAEPKKPKAKR